MLLDQYSLLIEDHKRLKSDYEEEREAGEKYKQMAKDQERNPFVLVLIDGDGYVFSDTLVSKRAEGGAMAAQLLNEESMPTFQGLSKALAKTGPVGGECRPLGPFIANFNRAYGLTEFVDAGELKENADFKLRALLRLYANNTQCKHIYFAACHDVGYISELTPFMGQADKFTLVRSTGVRFHDEFAKLGMGVEELRGVFRHVPLDDAISRRFNLHANSVRSAIGLPRVASPAKRYVTAGAIIINNEQRNVCTFHAKGECRYGKSCKYLHSDPQDSDPPSPSSSSKSLVFANLPSKDDIPEGSVAINADNYRLDPYMSPVSPKTMSRLKARVDKRRVCNNYHLTGSCEAGRRCQYDHSPIDDDLLTALEWLARSQPCPRRGACRIASCVHAHICQQAECKHRGGRVLCKIPYFAHLEDLVVEDFVPGAGTGGSQGVERDEWEQFHQ
ncbi:hypothetical protein VTK26DRAFT_5724 [Humicola hyalothermophila]